MNATCKVNNVEMVQQLVAVSHLAITQDGNLAALPTTRILTPEPPLSFRGRTGSTATNALRVLVVAAALPQLGAAIRIRVGPGRRSGGLSHPLIIDVVRHGSLEA